LSIEYMILFLIKKLMGLFFLDIMYYLSKKAKWLPVFLVLFGILGFWEWNEVLRLTYNSHIQHPE
jgi:hypothetical protein